MMNSKSGEGKKVCVTGASGYIASWIVKLLLDRGYTVNATVRSLNDPKKVDHLIALDGAKDRLNLFEANLLEEGSFDAAIHGCDGVFHTASPVKLDVPNPQAELIDPAVNGTLNVLETCVRIPSIKRVVLTSSMAAVLLTGYEKFQLKPGFIMQKWYLLSKTLAEEAAWNFAKEYGLDMVSINPAVVIGPLLQPTVNASSFAVLSLVNGSETYQNVTFGWVHVKDVAEAHVLAFEIPSANGRYLLNESVNHVSEVVEILKELYPNLKLPTKPADDKPFDPTYKVCKEKVESLGIKYTPLKTGLKDTVECLIEKFISV